MKKNIYIVVGALTLLCLIILGVLLGAGNNGYAQEYEFNVSSTHLINVIENLKKSDTAFTPSSELNDPDSLDISNSHFNVEIRSKKLNTTFSLFIEGSSKNKASSIYLVAVNFTSDFRKWGLINKDFNSNENKMIKREFEKEVLSQLKLSYTDKGNGMFIFWK